MENFNDTKTSKQKASGEKVMVWHPREVDEIPTSGVIGDCIKLISTKETYYYTGSEWLRCRGLDDRSIDDRCIEDDPINHPAHYTKGIEAIDFILSWKMNYLEGNIIKYIARYKFKNGIEDLKKARWYIDRLIDFFSRENNQNSHSGEEERSK